MPARIFGPSKGNRRPTTAVPGSSGSGRPAPQKGGGGNKAAGSPEPTAASSTVETVSPSGVVTPGPAASESQREAIAKERHEARVQRAEERQKRIINRYVTKAYSPKVQKSQPFSLEKFSQGVKQAKSKVSATREDLLNHPAVQQANEEGKVVGPKGLSKIRERESQAKALEPKGPLTNFRPQSYGRENRQAKKYPGPTAIKARETIRQEEGGLSAEDIASGAKNLYGALSHQQGPNPIGKAVGAEVKNAYEAAKTRIGQEIGGTSFLHQTPTSKELQAVATFAIPSSGGAATRAAEEIGPAAAERVAGAIAKGKSLRDLPDILKSAPAAVREAVKESPATLRQAAREAPTVARGAASKAPAYAGRQAAKGAEKGLYSVGGLSTLGALHKGGLNVPGGAILEGQARAIAKDPLKVASSTANLFPGLLTGAFQLPVAAGASALQGSTKPLEGALAEQGNFFKHFGETYGSSNPATIEKATLEEGLLPEILAAPLVAKGVKSLGGDALRTRIEDAVSSRRQPLLDEHGNIVTHEQHGGPVKKGSLRTGEETKLTRTAERNAHRREEAFHAANTNDLTELEYARRRAEVDKYARKAAGEKLPIREGLGPKGKDTLYARSPDFIPFLVRAGIDLSKPEAAAREVAHYEQLFRGVKLPHELGATPEGLTARDAVDYFSTFPEKLRDPNLAKAVEAYRAMATGEKGLRPLHTSERNRYLAYATAHDIALPEERVPREARAHTKATTRAGAWEDLRAREKQVRKLRKEAGEKRIEARSAPAAKAAKLRRESKDIYATAKTIEKGRQELLDGLKGYTRPWAKANPNAKRLPYDEALEREFVAEARKGMSERGLNPEPAYVPDSAAILKGTPDQSATGGKKPLEGAPKINEGYVWRNGLSRQGYEHLMNEGILRQVSRAYQWEDWRRFRDERGISFEGAYQHSGQDWQRAFDQGRLNPRDVALVPKQVLNRLEKTVKGGDPTDYERALADAMAARSVNVRDAQPGTVYEAFPKAAYDEKVAQSQKSPISPILRKANTVTSRTMLSTPSFVGAQLVAETAQAIADVNPARMMQGLRAYNRLTEEQKLRISGVSGETARAIFSPEDLRTTLGSYDSKPFKDALSFFRRNVFARGAKDVATMKWAGEVNRATGSFTRRAVLTGQVARDVNGLWAKGRKLLNIQTELQRTLDEVTRGLRGKARIDAALAYLAEHPRALDHYGRSLNEAMGGWTNLTRTGHLPESYRAAALVFYPFLRMSLQWPLKYAINHPIKATALTYLAAENNFALREALHGEPSFLNYAQIPVYGVGPKGEGVIINLSRIAPGGNALTEAIQGSGSAMGALQPVIAAGITGATGQGSFGPVEGGLGAHLKAAGAQILGLSPYIRAADTLRGQKASGQSEFGILAKRANIAAEPLAALEAKLKGSPTSQLSRSLLNPFQPTPKARAADQAKLGRILQTLSANSTDKQNKLTNRKQVEKMKATSKKASAELEAMYQKYGLGEVAKRDEEIWEYSHPYGESSKSGFGSKGWESNAWSGSGWGGNEKPPKVPYETSGVSLPHISLSGGLSSITGTIGSLLGGEAAQAATRRNPRGSAATAVISSNPNRPTKARPEEKKAKARSIKAARHISKSLEGWGLSPKKVAILSRVERETGVPAALLASISKTESGNGTSTLPGVHSGQNAYGAAGPFQMGNGTGASGDAWQTYSQKVWGAEASKHSVYNYADAARAAGEYLKEAGVTANPETWYAGGLAYNHADWYAQEVSDNAKAAAALPWHHVSGKAVPRGPAFVPGKGRYVFPFAKGWETSRTDMGKDYAYTEPGAPIRALGSGTVVQTGAPGWPGEGGVLLKLDHAKGLPSPYIFTYEGVEPTVHAGQHVGKGQLIGRGGITGSIETGFADSSGQALATSEYSYNGLETKYGKAMANLLEGLAKGKTRIPRKLLNVGGGTGSYSGSTTYVTSEGALTPTAVSSYSQATGAPTKQVAKELKEKKLHPANLLKKLQEVERIYAGKIPGFGTTSKASPDLGAIGRAVEESRRKLLA